MKDAGTALIKISVRTIKMNDLILSQDIDEMISIIDRVRKDTGTDMFKMSIALRHVKDTGMYKKKCENWNEFVEKYLKMSVKTVDKFIQLGRYYDEQTFVDWGSNKLTILLSVEESERKKIIGFYRPEELPVNRLKELVSPLKKDTEKLDAVIEKDKEKHVFRRAWSKIELIRVEVSKLTIDLIEFYNILKECNERESFKDTKFFQDIYDTKKKVEEELKAIARDLK